MKTGVFFLIVTLIVSIMIPSVLADGYDKDPVLSIADQNVLVMPASLRLIDEEAFEGTGASFIILKDSVTSIGRRAFANNENLLGIIITQGTRDIDQTAFDNDLGMVIFGYAGSYAQEWARKHGITFFVIEDKALIHKPVCSESGALLLLLLYSIIQRVDRRRHAYEISDEMITTLPKEMEQYYPINYDFP